MDTWGEGNLENDDAVRFVDRIAAEIRRELQLPGSVKEVCVVMAAIEMDCSLMQHSRLAPPKAEGMQSLRDKVLEIYDAHVADGNGPDELSNQRRQVIVDTFANYLDMINQAAVKQTATSQANPE